jgi:hypothetical protein
MARHQRITTARKRGLESTINGYKAHPPSADRANALAPNLLQRVLQIDNPLGLSIDRADLVRLLADPQPWDKLVCYVGLDEDEVTYRPVIYIYNAVSATDWQVVVPGGGGGGGLTANSVPPPNSPPPP